MTSDMLRHEALEYGNASKGATPAPDHEGVQLSVRELTRLLHIDCPDDAWLARSAFALRRVREGE